MFWFLILSLLSTGISIKSGAEGVEAGKAIAAPYALFPSVIPEAVLAQAKSSMVHFSSLMHKVSMDHEFMEQCLSRFSDYIHVYISVYKHVTDCMMMNSYRSL